MTWRAGWLRMTSQFFGLKDQPWLPPDHRIRATRESPLAHCIDVAIEGPLMPEVTPGECCPQVDIVCMIHDGEEVEGWFVWRTGCSASWRFSWPGVVDHKDDKTLADCASRFNNVANFQSFEQVFPKHTPLHQPKVIQGMERAQWHLAALGRVDAHGEVFSDKALEELRQFFDAARDKTGFRFKP